jgi:hypothetical protein
MIVALGTFIATMLLLRFSDVPGLKLANEISPTTMI